MATDRRPQLGPRLRGTLSRITEEAAHLLDVEGAGLRLIEGDELIRVAAYGPEGGVMARERLRLGESLSGRVAASGRPVIVASPEDEPSQDAVYRAIAQQHGFRSWLGVPLRADARVIGVLVMQSRTEQRFGPADVRLLEAFAGQAAIAIENAQLFEREHERRRQLEAVREVTAWLASETDLATLLKRMSRLVTELLGVGSVVVYLWDEPSATLVPRAWHGFGDWLGQLRLGLGEGVAGTVAQGRVGVVVDDYRSASYAQRMVLEQSGTRAVIGEPLLYEGELRGVITAAIQDEERTFSEQDRQLLALFAAQAVIAIEHARLHDARARASADAEVARRRATFLAEVSAALATSLDYEATLGEVARLAVPTMGDWCTVYMLDQDGAVRRVAVAYADPAKAPFAEALSCYPPSPASPRSTIAEVLRTGRAVLTPEIPASYVDALAQDAEHREIMRQLDFRSSMTVALGARGEVFGALALFSCAPDRRYEPGDVEVAEDLARRAGQAIDNARLYRDAHRAIRARDEFLSMVAHELRTPITSLLGFAQLARKQLGGPTPISARVAERTLGAIDRQSIRLAALVARLLDVSRLDTSLLTLQCQPVALEVIAEHVVAGARVRSSRHLLTLDAPERVIATVDPVRIEQVLANLVENAIKYSPNGGPVELSIRTSPPGHAEIAVRDHGDGVPPERRARIFERYYRAHADEQTSGLGLGLYISNEMVRLHGGDLRAEFPDDGGSRFVVTLPLDGRPA
jgi:signal transduction histidine kinase/putative methionine-R-sulfoxide reductase with GAF domain